MPIYFATVLPGLEHVLEEEIGVRLMDAGLEHTARGKVYFSSKLPSDALMDLRTADNVYRVIRRFQIGPYRMHLVELEKELSELDLAWAARKLSGMIRFKVNASRTGKHTYSRFEAADAAMRGIAKRHKRWKEGTSDDHNLEFRLDIEHENAVLSLRLTDAAFRYRSENRMFTQAALRPTVAHALVWLSKPEATDVFLDPCCGSGTIISERLAYPALQIMGGDISEAAVHAAAENAGKHKHVQIHRWDARELPLDSGYVDKVVTNLPFGRQIAAGEDIFKLYHGVLNELSRIMKKNGVALCLTETVGLLPEALERLPFTCMNTYALSLKGLHATLYMLKKH